MGAYARMVIDLTRRSDLPWLGEGVSVSRWPLLDAVRAAFRVRRRTSSGDHIHFEVGSQDVNVFLCLLLTRALGGRRRITTTVHDPPTLVKHPGAGLVPVRGRLSSVLAYRVVDRATARLLIRAAVRGSEALLTFAERSGLPQHKAITVPLAVPPRSGEDDGGTPPSRSRFVLFAGFIGPSKGTMDLLAAWARVAPTHPGYRLVLAGETAGDDPTTVRYAAEVRAAVAADPRVSWERGVDDAAFAGLVSDAACVVLPYHDSSPASAVLAASLRSGRPVITTPVPATVALRRLLADQGCPNIRIVPIGAPDALAEALDRMLERPEARDDTDGRVAEIADRLFDGTAYIRSVERFPA